MDANDFYLILFAQIVNHETLPHPGQEIYIIENRDRKNKSIRFSRQPWDPKTQQHKTKQYFQFKEMGKYWDALAPYWGKPISTESLKQEIPDLFGSKKKGYNCIPIFLFLLLQKIGLVKEITGQGTPTEPYTVVLPPDPDAAMEAGSGSGRPKPAEETPVPDEPAKTESGDQV